MLPPNSEVSMKTLFTERDLNLVGHEGAGRVEPSKRRRLRTAPRLCGSARLRSSRLAARRAAWWRPGGLAHPPGAHVDLRGGVLRELRSAPRWTLAVTTGARLRCPTVQVHSVRERRLAARAVSASAASTSRRSRSSAGAKSSGACLLICKRPARYCGTWGGRKRPPTGLRGGLTGGFERRSWW